MGPLTRMTDDANFMGAHLKGNAATVLRKRVGGSNTNLDTGTHAVSEPHTLKLVSDGSDHEFFIDAASHLTATDGTISGVTLGGVKGRHAIGDDFEVSDLSAGGGIIYTQLEAGLERGVQRGMWTGRP